MGGKGVPRHTPPVGFIVLALTLLTQARRLAAMSMKSPGLDHSFGSHSRMVPYQLQETAKRPLAEKATLVTGSIPSLRKTQRCTPPSRSHRRMVQSTLPDRKEWPSGETARLV